jgi:hypothetical protein
MNTFLLMRNHVTLLEQHLGHDANCGLNPAQFLHQLYGRQGVFSPIGSRRLNWMNRTVLGFIAFAFSFASAGAEPSGGKLQADGTIRFYQEFGTVITEPDGTVLLKVDQAKHAAKIELPGFSIRDIKSKDGAVMFITDTTSQGYTAN